MGSESDRSEISGRHAAVVSLLGEDRARQVELRYQDAKAWRERTFTESGRADRDSIRKYRNIYAGRRCVIIGNGPSLRQTNMDLLRDEITFGLNRIYLMFDQLGFTPTFHAVINRLVVEQCADDLRQIRVPLFTCKQNRDLLGGMPNAIFLTELQGPRFVSDAAQGFWAGGTVTYLAMQLAYYMGFSKVVLVGVDHRFAVSGPPNQVVESKGPDDSHFDPNYFGKGFKWQLPDYEASEMAYTLARDHYQRHGRQIVDATVDGALTIFPKMSLDKALGQ
jgi:hypothetical protein